MLKRSYKRIHFVGIGGSGVSALAHLMLQMGKDVTGSDCQSNAVTRNLEAAGATIWEGHDERYVRQADLVVYSTAIPESNPELKYAIQNGTPMLTRIQLLSYLSERKDSVVISGSHGKSTTSSMVAHAFMAARRDPTVVLGSVLKDAQVGSARLGDSDLFVCEGDESNNSILELHPTVATVTNIDCDHMDFHGSLAKLKDSFLRFLNAPGRKGHSVICLDDDNLRSIQSSLETQVISYGFHPEADYQVQGRKLNDVGGLSFEVHHKERGPLGQVRMEYPGDHHIQNALCTVAICTELGVKFDQIAWALETFPGVRRRYDIQYKNGVAVIDDYAHHPSEIMALLKSVREVFAGRVRVIFQPHRYTRSKNLAQQFPQGFVHADEIILAPIYTAHEKPIAGIGLDYLNRFFQRQYDERVLKCLNEFDEIYEYVLDSLQPGDVILTVGAGDVYKIGQRIAAELKRRDGEREAGVDVERLEAEMTESADFFSE